MGYSTREISKITCIPRSTIQHWIKGESKPPSMRWRPDSKDIEILSYILGVLDGDASSLETTNYRYKVKLEAIDREFVDTFSKALSKLLGKPYKKPIKLGNGRYYIEYHSKAFYTWHKKLTKQEKQKIIEHNKETVRQYLRGLYDSDGGNYRCKTISLSNSNDEILNYAKYLLKKYFNIKTSRPYIVVHKGEEKYFRNRGKNYKANVEVKNVYITRRRDVMKFLMEIGFTIKRKQRGESRRKN